jgi:hypothetical protein
MPQMMIGMLLVLMAFIIFPSSGWVFWAVLILGIIFAVCSLGTEKPTQGDI